MTIDPEKLEEAAEHLSKQAQTEHDWIHVRRSQVVIAVEAARITLNSLPRYKEVEVADWAVVNSYGAIVGNFREDECGARQNARQRSLSGHDEYSVVRLTGTAKVKVTP